MGIFRKTPEKKKNSQYKNENENAREKSSPEKDDSVEFVGKDLNDYVNKIKEDFGNSGDLVVSTFKLDEELDIIFSTVYIKGLADGDLISNMSSELVKLISEFHDAEKSIDVETFIKYIAGFRALKEFYDFGTLYKELLGGNTVFLTHSGLKFFSVATNSNAGRSINEPTSQTIIKGPKDAFTESIDKNVYLIRTRIRNKDLRMEELDVGTVSHTKVRLMYIKGIAKEEIIQDLRSRIEKIFNDCVLDSGYIEEFIKTSRYSIFPTAMNSEKPDSAAAQILEGRVAILVDGTPYVLTTPALFLEFLQSSEDYYHHYFISSLMRVIRYISLFLTLLVPGLFIALTTFRQEMIPTPLLIGIAAQREGVPFPVFIEVLLMEVVFEILREAGIRMPRAVGSAVSIVGALVLGQAAVEAGLISAAVVIVVSLTAIASFAVTNYGMSNAVRFLRFVFIFISGVLGLYGITVGLIILVFHLCNLKSATVPYLAPVAPRIHGGNRDSVLRFPLWTMKYRPTGISGTDTERTDDRDIVNPELQKKPEFR